MSATSAFPLRRMARRLVSRNASLKLAMSAHGPKRARDSRNHAMQQRVGSQTPEQRNNGRMKLKYRGIWRVINSYPLQRVANGCPTYRTQFYSIIVSGDWSDRRGIIRRWHLLDQVSLREIAGRLGISRNTVRRYLRSEITEPSYAERRSPSAIDKYAFQLSALLKTEAAKSRKQRAH